MSRRTEARESNGSLKPGGRVDLRRRLHGLKWRFLDYAFSDEGLESWKRIPELPPVLRRRKYELAPRPPRQHVTTTAPPALRTSAGAIRDDKAAWEAYRQAPLRNFFLMYWDQEMWLFKKWTSWLAPVLPRYLRGIDRLLEVAKAEPVPDPEPHTPEELSRLIRAEAARIGLTAVGFAPFDPRYVYHENVGDIDAGSVIVCVLEEDYESETLVPSREHERRTFECYVRLADMNAKLAEFIHGLGIRAQPYGSGMPIMVIPFAVQAGLGQLGFNGQLLTPGAGARVTLGAICTNAELAHDEPVDFGIPGICAQCKVCVRRCPVGAIPGTPAVHRGVTKTKLKTERCLPIVGQAEGCAVCVKVCPIQRFGLEAVIAYHTETGRILGKDTDDLEGYTWTLDGHYYGVGEKPRISSEELLHPPELDFDPTLLYKPIPKENVIEEYVGSH
jgi:ferredoxin